jgi:hypothetical protein
MIDVRATLEQLPPDTDPKHQYRGFLELVANGESTPKGVTVRGMVLSSEADGWLRVAPENVARAGWDLSAERSRCLRTVTKQCATLNQRTDL